MVYHVVMLSGRFIAFGADKVEVDDDSYRFYDAYDCVVAEFDRKSIAGYIVFDEEEEDED